MRFSPSYNLKVFYVLCWTWAAIVVISMVASLAMTVSYETAVDRGAGCYWSDHLLLEVECIGDGTFLKSFLSLWLVVLVYGPVAVFFRPLVGVPLVLGTLGPFIFLIWYHWRSYRQRSRDRGPSCLPRETGRKGVSR